jgi:hypothetical protein
VKLLREASRELGRLEAHGERGWRQLAAPYRKELAGLVKRIEKVVAPKRAPRKKSPRKKAGKKVATKASSKAPVSASRDRPATSAGLPKVEVKAPAPSAVHASFPGGGAH